MKSGAGFTLIELLVVISIIGLLSSILIVSLNESREKARRTVTVANIKQMQKALELYLDHNGFYPPDVNRGWDPGLAKLLPYDVYNPSQDCATNSALCPAGNPPAIPNNWVTVVQARKGGPYIAAWPKTTPWGGTYDYNYWTAVTNRNGCMVPAGIYLGIESGSGFTVDPATEAKLFNEGFDDDGCINNGEAQILLIKF